MEEGVFWHEWSEAYTVEGVGGGKCPAEKDVCRIGHGQCHAERCIVKKVLKPCERNDRVDYLRSHYSCSLHRACQLLNLARSQYYYQYKKDDSLVKEKLLSLANEHPKEGQDKYYARIRNEGLGWSYKRIRRVYLSLGLQHQ